MLRALSILISFSLSVGSATAGTPPLRSRMERVCSLLIEASMTHRTRSEVEALFSGTLFQEVPLFFPNYPLSQQYRKIAVDQALRQMAGGRPSLFAQQGIVSVSEHLWHSKMTPAQFEQAIERAVTESLPLTRRAFEGYAEVPWGEIRLETSSPLLRGSIANFQRTGLKIYATSLETALSTQLPHLEQNFQMAIDSRLLIENSSRIEDEATDVLLSVLERYGTYNAHSEPKGIYLASYYVLATPSEYLLHEIAHVSQDVSWDLLGLIDIFQQHARMRTRSPSSASLEHLLKVKKQHFLNDSLDPAYQKKVWARGEELGFETLDWLDFLDLLTLLKELDSHTQAAQLAREHGRLGDQFENEQAIFNYVFELYQEKQGALTSLCSHLKKSPDPILRLVEWLNRSRVYRSPLP